MDNLNTNKNIIIKEALTDTEIQRCFPTMQVLRPHLIEGEFVNQIRRMQIEGFKLAYLADKGNIKSVAGYRIHEFLVRGKNLYIDDLSTLEQERGKGYGSCLLQWLIDLAKSQQCNSVHLDSGYQRHGAHRLYLNRGFILTSHHFALKL